MHWLDRLYAAAVGRPRFFHDGWGDLEAAGDLLDFVRTPRDPAPIRPDVRRVTHVDGVHVFEGSFESPSAGLPPESRKARFELLLPAGHADAPVCVYLAATGEEDGSRRRRLALPLVRAGIGALLLENPFYGRRRPARQTRERSPQRRRSVRDEPRHDRRGARPPRLAARARPPRRRGLWLQHGGIDRRVHRGLHAVPGRHHRRRRGEQRCDADDAQHPQPAGPLGSPRRSGRGQASARGGPRRGGAPRSPASPTILAAPRSLAAGATATSTPTASSAFTTTGRARRCAGSTPAHVAGITVHGAGAPARDRRHVRAKRGFLGGFKRHQHGS